MIYVTGDTHGGIDVKKLLDPQLEKKIGKDDYLIICGDFGFIWNPSGESAKERNWRRHWMRQKGKENIHVSWMPATENCRRKQTGMR